MPLGLARLAGRAGEDQVVGGAVHAGVEPLGAVDDPARHRRVLAWVSSQVASEPCCGSVSPNAIERSPVISASDHAARLRVGAEPVHHDDLREVADDRRLVLQVVVQAETLVRQMFPDDRHVEVGAVAATERRRQAVAQPARLVGAPAHLGEQILPLPRRDAVVVPVGAGVLPTLVEVLHVLGFQRLDLALDERVHLGEQPRKVFGQREIHGDFSLGAVQGLLPYRREGRDGILVADLQSERPEPARATNTVVKFSNSNAMAAAVCSGLSSDA